MRALVIAALVLLGGAPAQAQLVLGGEAPLLENQGALYNADDAEPRMGGALSFSMFEPSFTNHRDWYDQYFHHGDMPFVQGAYWWYFLRGPVSVAAYGSLGFWQEYGKSQRCLNAAGAIIECTEAGVVSTTDGNDPNSLNLIPLSLAVEARATWFKTALGVPLVPYVRGSLLYTLWWVWAGGSLAENAAGEAGIGGVFGIGGTAGLALNLDFIDQVTAREAYRSWGLIDSYLYFEYSWTTQNSFSDTTLDFSAQYWTVGISVDF